MKKPIIVMTSNVCCWNDSHFTNDNPHNAVCRRLPRVKALYKKYMPDIIGAQEVTLTWKNYLTEAMSEYGIVGDAREAIIDPEHSSILYKKERFELIKTETFALSESGEFGSLGWGEEYPRICTYAILKDKINGDELCFFNTHLALNNDARIKMLELIFAKMDSFNLPLILTGDFNTTETSDSYKLCTESRFDDTKYIAKDSDSGVTWHNYEGSDFSSNTSRHPEYRVSPIDYILSSKGDFECLKHKIVKETVDGFYPSDHYFVISEVVLK